MNASKMVRNTYGVIFEIKTIILHLGFPDTVTLNRNGMVQLIRVRNLIRLTWVNRLWANLYIYLITVVFSSDLHFGMPFISISVSHTHT